jgi:hypothetical protein
VPVFVCLDGATQKPGPEVALRFHGDQEIPRGSTLFGAVSPGVRDQAERGPM